MKFSHHQTSTNHKKSDMQFFVSILNDVKPDSGWDADTLQQGAKDDLDKNQNERKAPEINFEF